MHEPWLPSVKSSEAAWFLDPERYPNTKQNQDVKKNIASSKIGEKKKKKEARMEKKYLHHKIDYATVTTF